nr:hypothetical protein CFP56_04501 [Quercus suber]
MRTTTLEAAWPDIVSARIPRWQDSVVERAWERKEIYVLLQPGCGNLFRHRHNDSDVCITNELKTGFIS